MRVIYYSQLADGEVWLLTMYAKSEREKISGKVLKKIRDAVNAKDD